MGPSNSGQFICNSPSGIFLDFVRQFSLVSQKKRKDLVLPIHWFAVYVVVQFYPWFNFYFPLFSFMLTYDNEYETKENKNWTKDKIELQRILHGLANIHHYLPPLRWIIVVIIQQTDTYVHIWSGSPQYLSCVHDRYPAIYVTDHLEVHCRFSFVACSGGHFEKWGSLLSNVLRKF